MPRISDMFPGRYMSYKHFADGESAVVTIRRVELEQVRLQGGGYGRQGFQGRQGAGAQAPSAPPEPSWLLHFDEYEKPMKLRKSRAGRIEILLGSDNTDDWIGRAIEIYRGWVQIAGENVEGLLISDRLPAQQKALLRSDALYDVDAAERLLPAEAVERFVQKVRGAGSTWDAFLAWLRGVSPHGFAAAFGVALDRVPASITPAMVEYLKVLGVPVGSAGALPAQAAAATQPVSQVLRPAAPPPAPIPITPRREVVDEIQEEDIPF